MKRGLKRNISRLIMVVIIIMPVVMLAGVSIVSAQELQTKPNFDSGIVSCTGVSSADGGVPCNWCTFVQLIGNMVQYSIYLAVMLSALMFAYAGFLFLTNNGKEANITKAWSIFRRSLLGTVAILAAWLIVNAIMTKLATGLGLGDNWNSISGCSEISTGTTTKGDLRNNIGSTPGVQQVYLGNDYWLNNPVRNTQYDPTTGQVTYDNTRLSSNTNKYILPGGNTNVYKSDALVALESVGYRKNNVPCNKTTLAGTCFYGMQSGAVGAATLMMKDCKETYAGACTGSNGLILTGGTEKLDRNNNAIHSGSGTCNHHNGCKWDLDDNTTANNFINNDKYFFDYTGSHHGSAARVHKSSGALCVRESNHWDCKK